MSFPEEQVSTAQPGYAFQRLQRALETAANHPDPEVRSRALRKADRWRNVLLGMSSGSLSPGSRTPVADTPPWVTLEVAHGGFATGRCLAEGPLQRHEEELSLLLRDELPGLTERARLNRYYLSDAGQRELLHAMRTGSYTVDLPEEGALPVAVWLLEQGRVPEALSLLETLQPFMSRLRFYPKLESRSRVAGHLVHRLSVDEVREGLARQRTSPRVEAMREALGVWNPLFDRLVALWLETIEGEAPTLEGGAVRGGWPAITPPGWDKRRTQWRRDYREASHNYRLCGKHRHPKSNFSRLKSALSRHQAGGGGLTVQERGWVRRALANALSKRGLPGSSRWREVRAEQSAQLERATKHQLAEAIQDRLGDHPSGAGLLAVSPLLDDIEGKLRRVFERKLNLAREAPVGELVRRGVIGSAEVLAEVIPQLTSQVAAAGLPDPVLRELLARIYTAFKRRRSLLLLNYQSQVRLEELPWVAVMANLRRDDQERRTVARQTLEEVSLLALENFPHTIIPNPLVSELSRLARQSEFDLPWVEEVAADIFMGRLLDKWEKAARLAHGWLQGTFYADYYSLELPGPEGFTALCRARSEEAGSGGGYVANNGAVLEQSQILTTHNLAVLTFGLGLEERVRQLAPDLAERAFDFVIARQNRPLDRRRARLQMLKNTAYAWRQAIFFLSLTSPSQREALLTSLQNKAYTQNEKWLFAFQPALNGLLHIHEGGRFNGRGLGIGNRQARRFLGWSRGPHWLTQATRKPGD